MDVCLIQSKVGNSKNENLENIEKAIPYSKNIDLLLFPEFFNSPYDIELYEVYAEELKDGYCTYDFLKKLSRKIPNTYIIAGSIPERDIETIYNTCTVWKGGKMINKYRKIHLFDVDQQNFKFCESNFISSGKEPIIVDTPFCKIGLGVCFDLRFNTLSNYYGLNGCDIICYPANFSIDTGIKHWELLNRARAVDTQCYILSCSTATNKLLRYQSYGHSIIVEPWGNIISILDSTEDVIYKKIYPNKSQNFKQVIPVIKNPNFNVLEL